MKVVFKDEDEKKKFILAIRGNCCPENFEFEEQECSELTCLECWKKALENIPCESYKEGEI